MAGIPTGLPGIPLLTTKLFVPTTRSDLVIRPRLLDRLADGGGARCTLLAAQAGAGKTTLLAAWLASRESPVA
jgi:LuxR family maltose regulon positive regulatory protein